MRRPTHQPAKARSFRPRLERLEDRVVPASIVWVNRNDEANLFDKTFGSQAGAARLVVNAAIRHWGRLIENFNYEDGSNTFRLTISMEDEGSGRWGKGEPSDWIGDKPSAGCIFLGRGDDTSGDGLGDGAGYYLDPNPDDFAEFTGVLNAFVGDGGPAGTDFYSLVAHEIGHTLGFIDLVNLPYGEDTGVGGGEGTPDDPRDDWSYQVWRSPSVHALLYNYKGGVHFAGPDPTDPLFYLFYEGEEFYGALDFMNAQSQPNQRYLISNAVARILRDGYGYTIREPEYYGTFYSSLNQTNRALTLRGGAGDSADRFHVSVEAGQLIVSVDVGDDVPGTGPTDAFVSYFDVSRVRSIVIDAGGGDDTIDVESLPTSAPLTINAGDGNDVVNVGQFLAYDEFFRPLYNLTPVQGRVTVNGDGGADLLNVNDTFDPLDTSYTYTASFDHIRRPGAGRVVHDGVETLVLNSSRGQDSIDLLDTDADFSLTINGNGGDDRVRVSPNDGNMVYFAGTVIFNTGPLSRPTIEFNDRNAHGGYTYTLTDAPFRSEGIVSAFASNHFSAVFLQSLNVNVVVHSGNGDSQFDVEKRAWDASWTINAGDGDDTMTLNALGQDLSGVHNLTFDGQAGDDAVWLNDRASAAGRTYYIEGTTVGDNAFFPWITYRGTQSLTLNASDLPDTIDVVRTGAAVTVNAGAGLDTVLVGRGNYYNTVRHPVTINGQEDDADLTIDDTAATSTNRYTLTSTTFRKSGGRDTTLSYHGIRELRVDTSGNRDVITIEGKSVHTATTVRAGGGADEFIVTPETGALGAVTGLVLEGGDGADKLTVHDHNNPYHGGVYNGLYDITATAVQRYREWDGVGPKPVGFAYSSVSQVTLYAGGRDDVIRVHRPAVTVKAGGGDDEIHVAPDIHDLATAGGVVADGEDGTDKVFLYDENNPYDTAFNRGLYTLAVGQLTRFYQPIGFPSPLQLTVGYVTEELDIRTGGQADAVVVNSAPGETKLNTGAGVDVVTAALAGLAGKLIVLGGADRAVLTLGGSGAAGETHTYALDATGPAFILDVDGTRRVQGGGLLGVTLNTAASNDDVTVRDTEVPMAINTNGGTDRVTVESVGAALAVNGGAGLDEFFVTPTAGNIERVVGLSLDGGAGGAALSINDTNRTYGALGSTNYTIASDQVSRVGRVRVSDPPSLIALGFLNVTSLSVDTGGSGDDVSVLSTPGPTTVNAGGGDDVVRLGGTARNWQLTPHVEVNGGDGVNRLIMDDRNNPYNFTGVSHKYGVSDSAMWRFYAGAGGGLFQATVYYGDVNELTLMTGDRAVQGDEVRVVGTPGAATIRTGLGDDTILVGDATHPLGGPYLTVDAGDGLDAVTLDDSATTSPRWYTIAGPEFWFDDAARLTHLSAERLYFTAGSGNDTLDITGVSPGTLPIVSGGVGSDVLTGSNLVNYFILLGPDQGSHSLGHYSSFENLRGGSGQDYFIITHGVDAGVSGWIDGGGGVNTLSYTQFVTELYYPSYQGDVAVNLALGTATAVADGIRNVQHVIGSVGSDHLVGDGNANILIGAGGNDVLEGGDGYDLLVGGPGGDTLRGGLGEDLLIGGNVTGVGSAHLAYVLANLEDLWARTDLGSQASVDEMRAAILAVLQSDNEPDTLLGEDDRDWFWADFADSLDYEVGTDLLN